MMNVLVVGASRPQFDKEAATTAIQQVAKAINELGNSVSGPVSVSEWDVDVQFTPKVQDMARAADLVVVVIATFVGSDLVVKILSGVENKAVLWAVPEPSVGLGRLQLNSLCGAIMTNNALKVVSHNIPVVYGDPIHAKTRDEFSIISAAEKTVRVLQSTVLGVIGQRPTGYYPSDFDELQLMGKLGVRVKRIPLAEAFRYGNNVSEEETINGMDDAHQQLQNIQHITSEQVEKSVRAERGLRKVIEEYGLTAMCVECWPQYMTEYGGAVCWANSQLIDNGIMAGCEADVHGTLTMLIQKELSGNSPFFGDLVHVANDDRLVFWHCGAAPLSLAGERPRASVHPNRRVGLTVDFSLKPGPVTVLRLHRDNLGQYSLMAIPGEAQDDPLYFSGNTVAVKPFTNAKKVLSQLMADGAEHHFSIGYDVSVAQIEALGRRLHIPVTIY